MALTSTVYTFNITLSDVDRHVYETLALKVACHPSETEDYLVTRVLAYCLEYAEGIRFSPGLSDPDEPTISIRDLTGALQAWIEIGAPDAARLHKAAKAAPRVALYTHKDVRTVLRAVEGGRIHRAAEIPVYAFDRGLLDELVARLDRRVTWTVSRTDGVLYVDADGATIEGALERHALPT